MTSPSKPPALPPETPSGASPLLANTNSLDRVESPADSASPSSANRDAKSSWKGSLRSSHRSNKRRGGGRFLLSQYFHHDSPEKGDRGRSVSEEPAPTSAGKGKEKASNGQRSSPEKAIDSQYTEDRSNSSDTRLSEDTGGNLVSNELGRRSTSSGLDDSRRSIDRNGSSEHISSLDASRIVSMALNLSEGRKRNLSGSHLVVPPPSIGHRVPSGKPPTLHGPYGSGPGGTLRRHLQEQRRVSRGIASESRKPTGNRASQLGYGLPVGSDVEGFDSAPLTLSHGTISRVEKAKRYIELSAAYMDLLYYLPPLKPRARYAGPTNDGRWDSHARDGSLGRRYNPLQMIRNRKARARERMELDPGPPSWDNSDAVRSWLEMVGLTSQDDDFLEGDEARLPTYPTRDFSSLLEDQTAEPVTSNRYKRPRVDWMISPPELLADAYWLERDQHKALTEDTHGNRLFPTLWSSAQDLTKKNASKLDQSNLSSPRYSLSSEKARDSDGLSDRRGRDTSGEYHESSAKLKQVWQRARRRSPSASSGLSYSDDEKGNRIRRPRRHTSSDFENTGPLERTFSKVIDVQSSKAHDAPNAVISPGTPDKWGSGHPGQRKTSSNEPDDVEPMDLDAWRTPDNVASRQRSKLFTPDIDESNPSSPVSSNFAHNNGGIAEKTLNGGKISSPPQKARRSLMPFAKSDPHKPERHPIHWPLGNEKGTRHLESQTPPRHSLDLPNRLARPPTRDSYMDADSPRLPAISGLPYSPRRQSKERERNKGFAAGLINSVGGLVRSEGHGRFRRKKESSAEPLDASADSPRISLEGSEAEQSSGSHGILTRRGTAPEKRIKNGVSGSGRSKDEPEGKKARPRLLERIELPSFRPSGSPSGSRPGTPDVQKSERRLLPAFRPLSRANSYRGVAKLPEAPTSEPQQTIASSSSPPPVPIPETHRPWPIHHAHQHNSHHHPHTLLHSPSDLARLRALLLCSGIKASGITSNYLTPRSPSKYLTEALNSSDMKNSEQLSSVSLASQPVAAASHLSSAINSASLNLHNQHGQLPSTITPLLARLTALRATASDLVDTARSAGDGAVNTTALMTGQKTIEVRQVIESVDLFRRKRRRRLRWIRRVAFGALEWGLLLAMWIIWLVVMVVNLVWKGLRGMVRVVRWAVWL